MTSVISEQRNNTFSRDNIQSSTVETERGEWITQAKCRNGDPDALFVRGAAQRRAAAICRHCPVAMQCCACLLYTSRCV